MKQIKYPDKDDIFETSITGVRFVITRVNADKGKVWLQALKGEEKKQFPINIETFYQKDLVKVKEE